MFLFTSLLYSFEVPYSTIPLKTESNLIDDFRRVNPPDSCAIGLNTQAWLWQDDKNLYVYVQCEIDEHFDLGIYANHDSSPNADYLRLQLITDLNNYFAYGYFAHPLGSKYDYIRKANHETDEYWNSRYSYDSEILNNQWNVTFTIPFSDLRHQNTPPYEWKIILTRYIKSDRQSFSAPFVLTKMGNDYFRRAHSITINHYIPNVSHFSFRPYTIFSYDMLDKSTSFDKENVGVDISYNPTPTIRSKLSISPDFSDVPMDAVTDTYNSKYTPTYTENRYFFIEDCDLFGQSNDLFYSRYIVQPDYAFKLTGSSQNVSFAFLSAKDKLVEERTVDDSITTVETITPDDFYNILTVKPVWNKFRCQFTLLNRMNEDYHNEVLHANPILEIGKNRYLWAELNGSTKEKNDKSKEGFHAKCGYSAYSRNHMLTFALQEMSENYALDMGKIYEDDFYGWNLDYASQTEIQSRVLSEIGHSTYISEEIDNRRNTLLERYLSLETDFTSKYNLDMELEFVYVMENINPASDNNKYTDKIRYGCRLIWNKLDWFIHKLSLNKVDYYFYSLKRNYQGT
ncbi:MAG TPA: hypothetical protein PLD62_01295, partial [Candidatus Cloacimonadota bacterium]|nr:hypothetical protein [Candidatus Cloacimonadota bacterium]